MSVIRFIRTLFSTFHDYLVSTGSRCVEVVKSAHGQDPRVAPLITLADEALETLRKVVAVDRSNAFTARLAQQDAVRDNLYYAFVGQLDAFARRVSRPEQVQAATRLLDGVQRVGRSLPKSYGDESAHLARFLTAMAETAAAADIESLQLGEWLTEIRTAETRFAELQSSKTEAVASTEPLPTLREAKFAFFDRMDMLGGMLDGLHTIEPNLYRDTIRQLNEIVEEAHRVQRGRISRQETDPNEPPPVA